MPISNAGDRFRTLSATHSPRIQIAGTAVSEILLVGGPTAWCTGATDTWFPTRVDWWHRTQVVQQWSWIPSTASIRCKICTFVGKKWQMSKCRVVVKDVRCNCIILWYSQWGNKETGYSDWEMHQALYTRLLDNLYFMTVHLGYGERNYTIQQHLKYSIASFIKRTSNFENLLHTQLALFQKPSCHRCSRMYEGKSISP